MTTDGVVDPEETAATPSEGATGEDAPAPRLRPADLPVSLRDRHPFTPDHYALPNGALPDDAPVYLLRYPDERTESLVRREWRSDGARVVTDLELDLHRREAVPLTCTDAQEQGRMRAVLERVGEFRQRLQRPGRKPLTEGEQREFGRALLDLVAFDQQAQLLHPPLARALADRDFYEERVRLAAAAFWLDGITTAGDVGYAQVRTFDRDALGRLTAEEREGIPLADRWACGWQAMVLRRPSPTQKKS